MGLPELWLQLPDGGPPPIKNVFASRQSAFFTVFYFIIIVSGGHFYGYDSVTAFFGSEMHSDFCRYYIRVFTFFCLESWIKFNFIMVVVLLRT